MLGAEMGAMNGQSAPQKDPNATLNACRDIDQAIETVSTWLVKLKELQKQREEDTNVDDERVERMDALCTDIKGAHESLVDRLKKIMSDPQSGSSRNAPQVRRVKRRLEGSLREYQQTRLDHGKELQDQTKRDIRIVNPQATDAEVDQAADDPGKPIYSSAVRYHDDGVQGWDLS
jgi:syntaxin 1B/2/3